jgi:hypothetical protein
MARPADQPRNARCLPPGGWHGGGLARTMNGMRIELLVVPQCPNESAAAQVLAQALADIGLGSVGFAVTVIDSQDDADRRHFIGSPTICVDGEDVFPEPGRPASVACRIYSGLAAGVPELRDLRQALKQAAALATSR